MLMEELPPEAALDGPPRDADHLLQRTLGTVRDESGGVLPGADVTAIQTDTGFRRG